MLRIKRNKVLPIILISMFPFIGYRALQSEQELELLVFPKDRFHQVGKPLTLFFTFNQVPKSCFLVVKGSYGETILYPKVENQNLLFELPDFLVEKSGQLQYILKSDQQIIYEDAIILYPLNKPVSPIESYLGPPSIIAGGEDFAMIISVPADRYDNPMKDSIPTSINFQFKEGIYKDSIALRNFISWKRIYSLPQKGRILVATEVGKVSSKEFSLEVYPAQPIDFNINLEQKHQYADGNQILTISTDIIKDRYGNTVSDGTFVSFIITKENSAPLKTFASTVNGVATARILHPENQESWLVQAYISGMAQSNEVSTSFIPAVDDFPVTFFANNRKIKIGPITSFMGQLIPDGSFVYADIFKDQKKIETIVKPLANGEVYISLEAPFYEEELYKIRIKTMGIEKSFEIKLGLETF